MVFSYPRQLQWNTRLIVLTRLLYMDDSYVKEFDAKVTMTGEGWFCLDQTAFYPRGGGLCSDTGFVIRSSGEKLRVREVVKDRETSAVKHLIEGDTRLEEGESVRGVIDWDRRYRVMRMHTGLHVLISVLNRKAGVLVTGNQVNPDRSRVDVNLEKPDRRLVEEAFEEANSILAKDIEVKIYYLPREEAMRIPGVVKLARAMPPSVEKLRIVEIPGVDIQADGGPHVRSTREVGKLVFLKLENKGRNNRRIYFTIEP